jgi:hypothetical protein
VQWYEQAQRAFDWFIGGDDLGLELYVPETGGCHDGLHADRVNGNQGAESTLAFLLSLVDMRQVQDMLASLKQSVTAEEYHSHTLEALRVNSFKDGFQGPTFLWLSRRKAAQGSSGKRL